MEANSGSTKSLWSRIVAVFKQPEAIQPAPDVPDPAMPQATVPATRPVSGEAEHGYSADVPILNAVQDQFQRAPFARRIAETISSRSDPSSIIIGIYGPWGDGKSSVLNMIREQL